MTEAILPGCAANLFMVCFIRNRSEYQFVFARDCRQAL